jgi:hypothetical protein
MSHQTNGLKWSHLGLLMMLLLACNCQSTGNIDDDNDLDHVGLDHEKTKYMTGMTENSTTIAR